MTLDNTLAAKTVLALGATACITAGAAIAPLSSAAAQDVLIPAPVAVPATPLTVVDAAVGPPVAYPVGGYPAYPGFPVSYYYEDTYIYYGPRRVAVAGAPWVAVADVSDPNWISYCSAKYRSFDPTTGTFLGYDGLRHPCT
jgi:hypothetical protein